MHALATAGEDVDAGRERGRVIDPISTLMRVERKLRELATELQSRRAGVLRSEITESDVRSMRDALIDFLDVYGSRRGWFDTLKGASEGGLVSQGISQMVGRLDAPLEAARRSLVAAYAIMEKCQDLPPDDPYCTKLVREGTPLMHMDDLMDSVEKVTGRRCGFASRSPQMRLRYDLPNFLNDVSNCVHVLAEWLPKSGLPASVRRVGERCNVVEGADKDLEDLCARWDERVREMASKKAYSHEDLEELTAIVTADEASFRVGSSPGHATRVKRDGRFIYYDRDAPVLNPVRFLMESSGYSCELVNLEALDCRPSDPDALRSGETRSRIADVMSWVTSADIRLARKLQDLCEVECAKSGRDRTVRERESCIDECIEGTERKEVHKARETRRGERIEPHPAALLDLQEYKITWWMRAER
jgi:hypothetical protein